MVSKKTMMRPPVSSSVYNCLTLPLVFRQCSQFCALLLSLLFMPSPSVFSVLLLHHDISTSVEARSISFLPCCSSSRSGKPILHDEDQHLQIDTYESDEFMKSELYQDTAREGEADVNLYETDDGENMIMK